MKPLSWIEQNYYTVLLMILATIAALVISIKYFRRHRELRIFTFYILFSLAQDASDFFRCISPKGAFIPALLEACITLGFLLFEFVVFIYFIHSYLASAKLRKIIQTFPVALIICTVCIIIFKLGYWYFFLTYCGLLALPCFFYFYEQFLTIHEKPLKDQPSFWVITGILFLNCGSLPLYFTRDALAKESNPAFTLNYLLYTVLFTLLIRAYICSAAIKTAVPATAAAGLKRIQNKEKMEPAY